jgi:hypothetical protein
MEGREVCGARPGISLRFHEFGGRGNTLRKAPSCPFILSKMAPLWVLVLNVHLEFC